MARRNVIRSSVRLKLIRALNIRDSCYGGRGVFLPIQLSVAGRAYQVRSSTRKFTSLDLILNRKGEVIICAKCRYALKPLDAVSKHFEDKHEIRAKDGYGLNAFMKQF
jgi:hypothetical protein